MSLFRHKWGCRKLAALGLLIAIAFLATVPQMAAAQTAPGYSLRFYGHGVDDIDRVKIPVQTATGSLPTDLGAADFTIEFWLRGGLSENRGAAVTCGQNEDWIYGSIVFDRDRFAEGRKFGLSIDSGGRVIFGVTNADRAARTICGTSNVLDGGWHHVAVQRRLSDGQVWLFVDGRLDATVTGPAGDLSYPDGVGVTYQGPGYCQGPGGAWGGNCRNEPFIVIGAEKHDAGASEGNPAAYPSFSGWFDELRLSNLLRYPAPFTAPAAPFTADANTVGLYHFDEGPAGACTGALLDSATVAGAPTNGVCAYGGAGVAGPQYTLETPFSSGVLSTSTATNTPMRATATATPLPPTATRTPTLTPAAPSPTATPAMGQNNALTFDGADDIVMLGQVTHAGTLTVEFWVRPATNAQEAIVLNQATDNAGWSVELNAGRPALWVATSRGWQVVRHSTRLLSGTWYHVAATYSNGAARVFVNGQPGTATVLQSGLGVAGALRFGGAPGFTHFAGALDDVRISGTVRYSTAFTPPAALPTATANTLGQWALNEGRDQMTADGAAGNTGQLGLSAAVDDADPVWSVAGR